MTIEKLDFATHVASPPAAIGWRDWYMVVILTVIYILSFADRSLLALMATPIKADLGITDLQLSLLMGLAFIILYSTLSIPAGYLADIFSRRMIVGGAVFFWSAMSALCGFANSYWTLFAGRTGLGIGEAALPPAAYSMIQGSFPPERRSRAFGIYHAGPPLGRGVALLAGGTLFALATGGAVRHIPILGALKPWQFAVAVPGLVGIPLAFLMLTVREPKRPAAPRITDSASFAELFHYVGQHWKLYVPLVAATTTILLGNTGFSSWMPSALGRDWGLAPAQIGHTLGTIELICSPTGFFCMGWLMSWAAKRRRPDAMILVSIAGMAITEICNLAALQMPTLPLAWTALAIASFAGNSFAILGAVVLTGITPGRLIGKVTSLFFLVQNLAGNAWGPTVVVLVSYLLPSGPRAIGNAMTITYGVAITAAIVLLAILAREMRLWHRPQREAS